MAWTNCPKMTVRCVMYAADDRVISDQTLNWEDLAEANGFSPIEVAEMERELEFGHVVTLGGGAAPWVEISAA